MGRARWQDVPVYRRDTLAAGQKLAGPALVIQLDATTYLPEGWRAEVDTEGNLRAAWHGSARA
jgi:N-methylhydantoinase A/oxoprolinase/acetone carboxylase beta subunit